MKKHILFYIAAGSLALAVQPAGADDAALPGEGFAASHYETLPDFVRETEQGLEAYRHHPRPQ